jgi:hypothetical protein
MARSIDVTPVLTGKDADRFLRETRNVVITPERRAWLESLAEESKKAEANK